MTVFTLWWYSRQWNYLLPAVSKKFFLFFLFNLIMCWMPFCPFKKHRQTCNKWGHKEVSCHSQKNKTLKHLPQDICIKYQLTYTISQANDTQCKQSEELIVAVLSVEVAVNNILVFTIGALLVTLAMVREATGYNPLL